MEDHSLMIQISAMHHSTRWLTEKPTVTLIIAIHNYTKKAFLSNKKWVKTTAYVTYSFTITTNFMPVVKTSTVTVLQNLHTGLQKLNLIYLPHNRLLSSKVSPYASHTYFMADATQNSARSVKYLQFSSCLKRKVFLVIQI
jgi:hypothetical protein